MFVGTCKKQNNSLVKNYQLVNTFTTVKTLFTIVKTYPLEKRKNYNNTGRVREGLNKAGLELF